MMYHYTVHGQSQGDKHVLLLHGFPDDGLLWQPQVHALVNAGYCAIVPDMLGCGRSPKPADAQPYKLRVVVQDLLSLLDALGVQAVHVVGHDWGAATAWRLALSHPARVLSLTVLSVGHPGGGAAAGGMAQRARWWYMLFFCQERAAALLTANNWSLFRAMLKETPPAVLDQYVARLAQPGALRGALNWYRANVTADMLGATVVRPVDTAWVVQCPVMGIWGERDTALTEEQMTISAQYVAPGCWHYYRVDEAGHWLQRDCPTHVNALLLRFLDKVRAKPKL